MNDRKNGDLVHLHRIPSSYVNEDCVLNGTHSGSIIVEAGKFRLFGINNGSLNIKGGEAEIFGAQNGSVTVSSGTNLTVSGAINGSVHISL